MRFLRIKHIPFVRGVLLDEVRYQREKKQFVRQVWAHIEKLPRTREDIQVAYAKPEYLERVDRAAKAEEEKRRNAHVGEGEQ